MLLIKMIKAHRNNNQKFKYLKFRIYKKIKDFSSCQTCKINLETRMGKGEIRMIYI